LRNLKMHSCSPITEFLLDKIKQSNKIFLFLDFDGTLVPIAPKPELAKPNQEILNLLGRLCANPNLRVAIVSGRSLSELEMFLPVPGLILVGVHGAEVKVPTSHGLALRGSLLSSVTTVPDNENSEEAVLRRLVKIAKGLIEGKRGFLLEDKGQAMALHYRLAKPKEAQELLNKFLVICHDLIDTHNLEIIHGKKVVEIRAKGINKKLAVEALWPSWPDSLAIYIGDDTTDEDGFSAVLQKGIGILIAHEERTTAAHFRLDAPKDAIEFLKDLEEIT